ncbi:MAG: hypothetical protein LBU47_05840 [Christensenellaceae bacterium]|jgi:lipoprotein signal peptidase|nr:hypothetical protein [Christensenellaceae bacterium]
MKQRLLGLWPYALIALLGLFGLPLIARTQPAGAEMVLMLVLLPAFVFAFSSIYGWRRGFDWLLPLAVGLFFLCTLFVFYNESAWVYAPGYAFLSLLGAAMGSLIARLFRRKP